MAFRVNRETNRRRSDFVAAVAGVPAALPALPYLLVIDGDRLRGAVEDDHIKPQLAFAPVSTEAAQSLAEEVGPAAVDAPPAGCLSLAYGRLDMPEGALQSGLWRDNPHWTPANSLLARGRASPAWPVLLVFHPHVAAHAAHLYPFPYAAWSTGRVDHDMLSGQSLDWFDLVSVSRAPLRLVRAIYRTNLNFLNKHPVPERRFVRKRRFAMDGYATWAQETAVTKHPDLATPELCLNRPLALSASLEAVMLPSMLLSDRIIADYLIGIGAEVRTYPHLGGIGSATRQPLQALYMDYLQGKGLLGHGR